MSSTVLPRSSVDADCDSSDDTFHIAAESFCSFSLGFGTSYWAGYSTGRAMISHGAQSGCDDGQSVILSVNSTAGSDQLNTSHVNISPDPSLIDSVDTNSLGDDSVILIDTPSIDVQSQGTVISSTPPAVPPPSPRLPCLSATLVSPPTEEEAQDMTCQVSPTPSEIQPAEPVSQPLYPSGQR